MEVCKSHGRVETRVTTATVRLRGHLAGDWTGLQQVVRIERRSVDAATGAEATQVAHAITSLPPARADARRLARLVRGHWQVENRLHWVRDMTLGEDRCRVRRGSAPQILAALRNAALLLMRLDGASNIAAACRRHSARPDEALILLRTPPKI